MDEYLQYMKTLRSHMNDAEDQAAKISAEEQMQMTNIHTLESDIDSAKSEITQVVEDTEKMNKSKVEICSTIMENQKKLAALESDSSRLTQTMELIRQEKVGLSAKFSERRAYYSTVAEDMVAKFEKQQIKLAIEDVKCRENEFKPELKAADITAIEEEYNALLSDKAGETEYLQSMEKQVEKLKEICHEIKCACGEKYTVALNIAGGYENMKTSGGCEFSSS
ncbi:hypothetical protein KIW84_076236 [Lathyrus oleraceus]|uniref:Uncharacterized protein n=1 Tax=Pisum sativum TaxID=3888 RepID=A0A9D4VX77_PEA|nr:hypothetical protein KIW84_076236 [Pisum sativum]